MGIRGRITESAFFLVRAVCFSAALEHKHSDKVSAAKACNVEVSQDLIVIAVIAPIAGTICCSKPPKRYCALSSMSVGLVPSRKRNQMQDDLSGPSWSLPGLRDSP